MWKSASINPASDDISTDMIVKSIENLLRMHKISDSTGISSLLI